MEGLYGELVICLIPLLVTNLLNSSDTNCGPLSLTISLGSPNLAEIVLSISIVVDDVVELVGII